MPKLHVGILLVIIYCIQNVHGNLVCPADWSKIYERCYAVFPTRTTYSEAVDNCNRYGGKLAEPAGLTVNYAVKNIVPSSITEYRIGYQRIGYTGSDDSLAYWSDNTPTNVEVGTWANFEPRVSNGNCVNVDTTNGLWYMKSCDLLMPSVCELVPCPGDTFRCSNGRVCLGQKYVCNGENDCGDSSDEQNCPSFCTKYMYDNSGAVQTIKHPAGNVNYPARSTCLWVLQGPPGTNIQVQVVNFKSEKNIDVLEFWEGEPAWYNGTCLAKISGDLTQDYNVLVSRNNFMTIRFISDVSVEMEGFTLQWRTSFHCQWTRFENRRMTVTDTTQYANCNSACLSDNNCLGFMNNKIDNSCYKITTFSQPLEDSCCDLYVKTCPGTSNFPVLSGIPNRGGTLPASRADNQIYTPFYPSLYPAGQQISWVIQTTGRYIVTLQVLDIELCGSDQILIKDGDSILSQTIATLTSGSTSGQVIMSTRNGMFILMSLHEHLSCRGVLLSYREGCDFSLSSDSGTFFTPGYAVKNYTEVMTCTWRIQSASGRKMKISFDHFDLATGDTLQVYIGANEQGTKFFANDGYTGYQANPQEVDVPNGQAYVVFKSHSMKRHKGFHATYKSACAGFGSDLSVSNTGDIFSPSTVTVSCANNGFYLQEPYTGLSLVTLECLPNGQYNQTTPQCDQAYCSIYPLVANSYISGGNGVRGGDSVNYTCLTGYSNTGTLSLTCRSDGSWNTPPSCTAASCPSLSSSLLGGSRRIVTGTGTSHGTILKYTCNSYYQLIGISTIACENGQWSNSPPKCTRIRCSIPNVNNGVLDKGAPLYQGDSITVTCTSGYVLDGQNPFLCGVDTVPKCNNINECSDATLCKCPVWATSCINGTCLDFNGGYNCDCPDGYTFSSGYCRDIAECSGITNMCHHTCTDSAGSYTCDCSNGYRLYSRLGVQGMVPLSGQTGLLPWNDLYINHSCIRVQCQSPLSRIASNQKALSVISSSSYYFGDKLRISCKVGYVILGRLSPEFEIQCLADGTWSSGFTCQVANCTRDSTFPSAVLPITSQIQYNQRYVLTCTLPDNTRVNRYQICSYNRTTNTYQLKGDRMACPVIDCGIPEFLAGGSYGFPCTTFGCNFTFGCAASSNYRKNGSSSYGDSTVRCESTGRWDFGSLTCIGGVCSDPGAPADGFRVNSAVASFSEGTMVTFGCNRPGYTVSSPYPLLCKVCDQTSDNILVWNTTRPICIDTQAPSFSFCTVIDYTITMLTAPNFLVPVPQDNSGLVQYMTVTTSNSRSNFHPSHVIDEDMTVTYTAFDAVGNAQSCQIAIHIRDEFPPALTCRASKEYTIINENYQEPVYINQTFVQLVETNAQIYTSPITVVISKQTIGLVQRASIAAFDAATNSATCNVQILTSAPKCQPWTLDVENANRVCLSTSDGGYRCAIQCNNDYRFFEDVDLDRVTYQCSPQGDWTRTPAITGSIYTHIDLPQCRPYSRSYYRQTNILRYQINTLSSLHPNCSGLYHQNLGLQWDTLMSNLQTLCRTNSVHSYIIAEPLDQNVDRMSVTISNSGTQSMVSVYVSFEIEIRLDSTNDNEFITCANKIKQAFQDMPTAVMAPVNGLPLSNSNGLNCPASTQTSAVVDSSLTNGFVCGRYNGCEKQQYLSSNSTTYCVQCPDNGKTGYFKNNTISWTKCGATTYRHPSDYTRCVPCPLGTRSILTGLARQDQCYLSCPLGMWSPNGLAPCTECGQNSYSNNGVNCVPCPTNTLTRGTGKTSSSDCLARCGTGEFSYDGHIPCKKCPRNYYQPSFGGTRCIPCSSGYITTGLGSTSSSNCTQGYDSLCLTSNPCQNGGTCFAIEHDFNCTCRPGYTGRRCENGLTVCASNPCYNNGTCSAVVGSNAFTCTCTGPQYDPATRCELKNKSYKTISDCGNENLCNKAGSGCNFTYGTLNCIQYGQLRRYCYCRPGYTGDRCQTNINECVSNPCQNGGQCIDNVNSFTCTCPPGYTGAFCEAWDEIAVCSGKCGAATCTDDFQKGNFTCMCPNDQFYESNTCSQINHCMSNPCHNGGTCNNRYGGYTCTCKPGNANPDCLKFVYECASNPCKNGGTCQDGQNNYTCNCPPGTQGKNCDDIPDNCTPNPCHPNNTASACQELINDFICPCKEGYYGKTCSEGNVNCNSFPCFHNATCTPTSTGYSCQCAIGWTGTHCDTEIDKCTSLTPCQNGATCVNIVNDYICRCTSNYVGGTCNILNDPCQVANPCANSATCYVSSGLPQCNCPTGFQGAGCHIRTDSCSTTNCQNGATCVIENLQAVCNCLPGYTGSQCQTDIDECASNPCPSNSRCIDGINSYTCDCNDGLIGQDCSKPMSHNFDFIVVSDIGCGETSTYTEDSLFNLGSDALSMSVWLRFTAKSNPGIVYSLYGLERNLSSPPLLLAQLAANTINFKLASSTTIITFSEEIDDGKWHHFVFTWNGRSSTGSSTTTGRVVFYIDGVQIAERTNFGTNGQLPHYGWVLIGREYDSNSRKIIQDNGFQGRLSRLYIMTSELNQSPDVNALYRHEIIYTPAIVIPKPIADMLENGRAVIDFQSELTSGKCLKSTSCVGIVDFSKYPSVSSCPGDTLSITQRGQKSVWSSSVFTGTTTVSSNRQSGAEELNWQTYGIWNVGKDSDNNAAVCTFRVYNRETACSNVVKPDLPLDGSQNCVSNAGMERCQISCPNNKFPVDAGPKYYICGTYSMYGEYERKEKFVYPACADSTDLTYNVEVRGSYNLTSSTCDDSVEDLLISGLRQSFTSVNSKWRGDGTGLCGTSCNLANVSITCVSNSRADFIVRFKRISNPLIATGNVNQNSQVFDAILNEVGQDSLDYTSNGQSLVRESVLVDLTPSCQDPYQVVGDHCVKCGQGYSYNNTAGTCTLCPVGQYQNEVGQRSCKSCQTGSTTKTRGSQSVSDCLPSCRAGRYYSSSSLGCQDCQIGYYQPARGKFSCIACDPGLITYGTGSTLKSQCIHPSSTTSAVTDTETPAPSIYKSMTTAEIAAVVIGCLIVIVLLVFILLCCLRNRLPCFVQEKVVPEGPTEWKNVNKYGETSLTFVSYKLNDLRAKRGVKPLEKRPIIPTIPEYSDDYIPRFTEKFQKKAKQRKPVVMANNQVASHVNNELPPIKIKKSKRGKRKSRKHRTPREYDDDPMNMMAPPSDTRLPKPLPARPPSDGSFNTSSSYLHAQNQSFNMSPEYMNPKSQSFKTSVASSHHYEEISPRYGPLPGRTQRSDNKIHIDSDDDMR